MAQLFSTNAEGSWLDLMTFAWEKGYEILGVNKN
jgi:hypothetical protein